LRNTAKTWTSSKVMKGMNKKQAIFIVVMTVIIAIATGLFLSMVTGKDFWEMLKLTFLGSAIIALLAGLVYTYDWLNF